MNVYAARREALLEKMEAGSMLLLYSGETVPCSLDEGYAFEANRNFFYLTGLRRENMARNSFCSESLRSLPIFMRLWMRTRPVRSVSSVT